MKNNNKSSNQKGILSLDFIFSIMAVYAISMVFSLLAITLMMSTVTQYMTFSMARAHISGQVGILEQQMAVQEQYDKLFGTYLGVLFKDDKKGGWFTLKSDGVASVYGDASWTGSGERQKPYGVKLRYTSNILKDIRLPLIGSPSDGGNGDFGVANLYTFLYREPTMQECQYFNKSRWQALKKKFPTISSMNGVSNDGAGEQSDNGC